jgi:hypothetical protein
MERAHLTSLFTGFAIKRMTPHEIDPVVSHGHEFQGVATLRRLFGDEDRRAVPCTYYWLPEDDGGVERIDSTITWYDSRRNAAQRSAEWRLVYTAAVDSILQEQVKPGDLALFALKQDTTIVVFLAAAGSSRERQICDLFSADVPEFILAPRDVDPGIKIEITGEILLAELGLDNLLPEQSEAKHVGQLLWAQFGGCFPSTRIFSREARATYRGEATLNNPDFILVEWFEWELQLFRYFEQRIIREILTKGFVSEDGNYDVDLFLVEAQTARQRRFSRAGKAFQWNLAAIFDHYEIQYSAEKFTEGKRRPDFLFPGVTEYHDPGYPVSNLRTLGAKTTCKDRWRQVINEAKRISPKHLITFEAPISEDQTDEMQEEKIQLVVPIPLQTKFSLTQRPQLISLADFLNELRLIQGV